MIKEFTGIYCIENKVNGNKYIGQSMAIHMRWLDHKRRLRRGAHGNYHLQKAWNKYGESNFIFYIIEICDKDSLNDREKYWIETFNAYKGKGYNAAPGGDVSGNVPSDEALKRMSEMWRGEKAPLNKYSERQILAVTSYLLAGIPKSYIADVTGVSKGMVIDIKHHKSWKYLTFWMDFPNSSASLAMKCKNAKKSARLPTI